MILFLKNPTDMIIHNNNFQKCAKFRRLSWEKGILIYKNQQFGNRLSKVCAVGLLGLGLGSSALACLPKFLF